MKKPLTTANSQRPKKWNAINIPLLLYHRLGKMATKTHIYNDLSTEGNVTRRQIDPYELLANAVIELAVQD